MSNYVIVSDATLDLPVNIIKEYGVHVIPMGVAIDDVTYTFDPEEKDLSVEEFYAKLQNGAVAQTTQITPSIFMDHFGKLLEQGLDILYISFSSGLSGTYNTSQLVIRELSEEYPDRKIYCIDSLCASIGEGLLVYHAALLKQKGFSLEQLKDWVELNKTAAKHWFTVTDLFYLKRGGRISSIEAMVGTALKIRPVLSMDNNGKLAVISKIRGSKSELDFLITKMEEGGIELASQTVIIGHADNLVKAQELEKLIRDRNLVQDIVITKIGPIIGSHTGPGMLALTFMGNTTVIS